MINYTEIHKIFEKLSDVSALKELAVSVAHPHAIYDGGWYLLVFKIEGGQHISMTPYIHFFFNQCDHLASDVCLHAYSVSDDSTAVNIPKFTENMTKVIFTLSSYLQGLTAEQLVNFLLEHIDKEARDIFTQFNVAVLYCKSNNVALFELHLIKVIKSKAAKRFPALVDKAEQLLQLDKVEHAARLEQLENAGRCIYFRKQTGIVTLRS